MQSSDAVFKISSIPSCSMPASRGAPEIGDAEVAHQLAPRIDNGQPRNPLIPHDFQGLRSHSLI